MGTSSLAPSAIASGAPPRRLEVVVGVNRKVHHNTPIALAYIVFVTPLVKLFYPLNPIVMAAPN